MLTALGEMASNQTINTATKKVTENVVWFLNYAATHPKAKIRYHASGMVSYIDSDASYLSVSKERSRVGGHFYLSSASTDPSKPPTTEPPSNGPLHATCSILRNVMASATEAELGGLFYNVQEAIILRTTLEELDHPQPATPTKTDNSTAAGIVIKSLKQRKSRSIQNQP